MVVTGDPSQSDLPGGVRMGLNEALAILEGVEGVGVARFCRKRRGAPCPRQPHRRRL